MSSLFIFHGEDIVGSRAALSRFLDTKSQPVIRLEGASVEASAVSEHMGTQSMFGETPIIVIESLHSAPNSNRKKALITLLAELRSEPVVLWESRELTKTMLKQFNGAEVHHFPHKNPLFQLMDALFNTPTAEKQQLLQRCFNHNSEWSILSMIHRQISLLLQLHWGGAVKAPPFVISKLRRQAKQASPRTLLKLHHQLVQLDRKHKSSNTILSLKEELDLLLTTV